MRRIQATLLTAALALGAAGAALGATQYATTVSIRHSSASGGKFSGTVRSSAQACVAGRQVTVYRRRPGPDRAIGSQSSGPGGKWLVDPAARVAAGDYYARTPTARRGNATCLGARSVTTHSS